MRLRVRVFSPSFIYCTELIHYLCSTLTDEVEAIIEAKGIEKSFGKLKVLKGIGLEVGRSEVLLF